MAKGNRTIRFFRQFISSTTDLSEKEKLVLIGRLKRQTLDKIGRVHSVSEARIRQIEYHALSKIRSKSHQLKLFK